MTDDDPEPAGHPTNLTELVNYLRQRPEVELSGPGRPAIRCRFAKHARGQLWFVPAAEEPEPLAVKANALRGPHGVAFDAAGVSVTSPFGEVSCRIAYAGGPASPGPVGVAEPAPNSLWRHPATDSLVLVLGVATCSTHGSREDVERSVIYWSFAGRRWHYRELAEFMDGRFEEQDG